MPRISQATPKGLIWFRAYLTILCLLYAGIRLGAFFAFFPSFGSKFAEDEVSPIIGRFLLIGLLYSLLPRHCHFS